MARRPVSRHTRADPLTPAVSGISLFPNPQDLESDSCPLIRCRSNIILLSWSIFSWKSVKYPISTAISNCREIAAFCCLRARSRRFSVASLVMDFSRVPLRFQRNLRAGSRGFFLYLHLVCSAEFFAVASERKSARKLFRRSLELMVLKDHEFGRNPTFPPYALHSCPFHVGISLCVGKRAIGMF